MRVLWLLSPRPQAHWGPSLSEVVVGPGTRAGPTPPGPGPPGANLNLPLSAAQPAAATVRLALSVPSGPSSRLQPELRTPTRWPRRGPPGAVTLPLGPRGSRPRLAEDVHTEDAYDATGTEVGRTAAALRWLPRAGQERNQDFFGGPIPAARGSRRKSGNGRDLPVFWILVYIYIPCNMEAATFLAACADTEHLMCDSLRPQSDLAREWTTRSGHWFGLTTRRSPSSQQSRHR
jgi:hypothetical protein